MDILILLGTCLLVGLDLYLSNRRIRTYGATVELNPVARQLAVDQGPTAAIVFLALWNLAILAVSVAYSPTALHILFGAKLGLAAMQLKSLQIETLIEQLLKRNGKKNQ